jgi:hypothetical protein
MTKVALFTAYAPLLPGLDCFALFTLRVLLHLICLTMPFFSLLFSRQWRTSMGLFPGQGHTGRGDHGRFVDFFILFHWF